MTKRDKALKAIKKLGRKWTPTREIANWATLTTREMAQYLKQMKKLGKVEDKRIKHNDTTVSLWRRRNG